MSRELAEKLLKYRHTHVDPESGRKLSQVKMVQKLREFGDVSIESYQKWERNLGDPNESNLENIRQLFKNS